MKRARVPSMCYHKELTTAVEEGNLELVEEILLSTKYNQTDCTILVKAIVSKNKDMVSLLLKHTPDIRFDAYEDIMGKTRTETTSEITSLLFNHPQRLSFYEIKRDSCPSLTPLQSAVTHGDIIELHQLLDEGEDVNERGYNGETALHLAARLQLESQCRSLIERGASVNMQNKDWNTALHFATSKCSSKIIKMLLHHGADINSQNLEGFNALHTLAVEGMDSADIPELLVANGININEPDHDGYTPLVSAVTYNKVGMVQSLLQYDVDIDGEYDVLEAAVSFSTSSIVKLLLRKGAKLNGSVALHQACKDDSAEKIDLLLKHGADIWMHDEEMGTPLSCLKNASKSTKRLVAKHLVKLQLNECVDRLNLSEMRSDPVLHEEYNDCLSELQRMKRVYIYDDISFYTVLSASSEKLSFLLKRHGFTHAAKLEMNSQEFPLYAEDLDEKLREVWRKEIQFKIQRSHLKSIFGNFLPDIPLELIAYYSLFAKQE